jgi:RNA polymerase sigma factor (sigma-70 family)
LRPLIEEDPDAELLARVGEHDPHAVREMVTRKLPRVLAMATRMLGDRAEAEDVAQETFVRIWKHAARWEVGNARFDTWMHRVVLNLCYDRLRGQRGQREEPVEDVADAVDPAKRPDEQFDERSRGDRVGAALARLPARQREALVLHYYQELSNEDAAALMGVSIEALESLLARARRNMRASLIGQGDAKDML